MQFNPRRLHLNTFVAIALMITIALLVISVNASNEAKADPWMSGFTDANGISVQLYSDSGYSVGVTQNATLTANTTYYMQVTSPTMSLSSEGSAANRMYLLDIRGSSVSFGSGSATTFTQQSGGPPYVYRLAFRTPSSANLVSGNIELRNTSGTKRATVYGWKMKVGSSTSYLRTYSDSGYTTETDTYAPGATVYAQMYNSAWDDPSASELAQSTATVSDFAGHNVLPTVSKSKPSTKTFRMSFVMPSSTAGDVGVEYIPRNGTSVLGRAKTVLHVVAGETVPPTVSAIAPSGTIITTSPTISASYSDSGSGINSATAVVYLDGVVRSGCTAGASSVSCPTYGLAQGSHNISVSVRDNAGNTGSGSGSFTIDTIAPAVSNIQPGGTITIGNATVSAYYSDAGSGINTGTAAVVLDGASLSGCTANGSSISCPATGLAVGAHIIGVSVSDNAGNSGSGSGSFTVADVVSPAVGNVAVDTSTISATFSDAAPSSGIASVGVAMDGTVVSGCAIGAGSVSCPTPGAAYGSHPVVVTVTDNAGNAGNAAASLDVPDVTAPVISGLVPSGTVYTSDVTLAGSFDDSESGIDTASASVYLDGSIDSSCTATATGISCTTTLAEGAHSFTVSIADNAGNTSSASSSFTVVTCSGIKPQLSLTPVRALWASYADYLARQLSMTYGISNRSSEVITNVSIIGVQNTNGVILSSTTPISVGDISEGATVQFTTKSTVPVGVTSFRTTPYATAKDMCGNSFDYPAPYPDV